MFNTTCGLRLFTVWNIDMISSSCISMHVVFTHSYSRKMLWWVPRIHSKMYGSVSSRNKPELRCPAELTRLLDWLTMLICCGYWLRHLRCCMGHATYGVRLSVFECGDLRAASDATRVSRPQRATAVYLENDTSAVYFILCVSEPDAGYNDVTTKQSFISLESTNTSGYLTWSALQLKLCMFFHTNVWR